MLLQHGGWEAPPISISTLGGQFGTCGRPRVFWENCGGVIELELPERPAIQQLNCRGWMPGAASCRREPRRCQSGHVGRGRTWGALNAVSAKMTSPSRSDNSQESEISPKPKAVRRCRQRPWTRETSANMGTWRLWAPTGRYPNMAFPIPSMPYSCIAYHFRFWYAIHAGIVKG
jgi:hypothetical protein